MQKSVGRIPKYISASSPKGLRRIMLKTQMKLGIGVEFFDIQFAQKKWIAWYYDGNDITPMNMKEQLNDVLDSERDS